MTAAAFLSDADEMNRTLRALCSHEVCVSAEHVARAIVSSGVASDAAAGWAVRTRSGWERGAGRATGSVTEEGGELEPIFDLASLTKPMTAFALARSGLSPSIPLGDVLEEARGTASEGISLELLLAHRAGLAAHLPLYEPLVSAAPFDRVACLRLAANARREDAAGTAPRGGFAPVYSDLGYVLVGEALARVRGASAAGEILERDIAAALGRRDLGTARTLRGRPEIAFDMSVRPTEVVPWRGGLVRGLVHDENAW
ncbi:MAG TPA: serine hydrolase domain-containing protein, partial [Labilithrix sp.]|nr:serine hydrolase domain-containing protein [Labilithrix sp.]